MSEKYKNKYRIESNRLPNWDYSNNGYYFITIVTQNRECNLGEIVNVPTIVETHGRASQQSASQQSTRASQQSNGASQQPNPASVQLSSFGKIVENEWNKSFEIRDELRCDKYIIMPNHIHAIIILEKSIIENPPTDISNKSFIRKPKSISSFVAGYKSAVNSKIDDYIDDYELNISKFNRKNHFFQANYYDHIIRNEKEYYRIAQYIIDNPINWENDKLKML